MDQLYAQFDAYTDEALEREARNLRICNIPTDRNELIKAIMNVTSRESPQASNVLEIQDLICNVRSNVNKEATQAINSNAQQPSVSTKVSSQEVGTSNLPTSTSESMLLQLCTLMTRQMQIQQEQTERQMLFQQSQADQQREMMRLIFNSVSRNAPSETRLPDLEEDQASIASLPESVNSARSTRSIRNTEEFSNFSTKGAKFLTLQISQFGGSEQENIELWINKIEKIANAHRLPSIAMLSAASSKLTKDAKKWFDHSDGSINSSWNDFKLAIVRRFKRRFLFTDIIDKAKERKWLFYKESFHSYATEKIAMLQCLNLTEQDVVNCLIQGITNLSVRTSAALLEQDSVDTFLEKMHPVTTTFTSSLKRSPTTKPKFDKFKKEENSASSQKSESSVKISKDISCTYCRLKGHTKENCRRIKRKDPPPRTSTSAGPTTTVATVEVTPSAEEDTTKTPVVTIATVIANVITTKRFEGVKNPIVKVTKLNNIDCSLLALIDSGSIVSFVNLSVFHKFLKDKENAITQSNLDMGAPNNISIDTKGMVESQIELEIFKNVDMNSYLEILPHDLSTVDLILGMDFLKINKIKTTIDYMNDDCRERVKLMCQVASTKIIEDNDKTISTLIKDTQIDFNSSIKNQLIEIVQEVENTKIPLIEDNHSVSINLKDTSIFAYSPRKFAWTERLQIRDIIDDLLKRNIIKESTSQYCARIVPVRKKNGTLRLCIDLRPLNERVVKQKYPFPVIEDFLARLGNKSVFTVLDLKDGFHHLKVHPDFTKYFSFATPDGQYEFLKLPFGFCEAPAEFQRRLVYILQPLIKADKILVYMDDILIPINSIKENLDILKQVLILLKSYNFCLNIKKCQFLKTTIEYLGYMITPSGITLSSRHVAAINDFPISRKILHVQQFLGLTNYFRKFIDNYAAIANPLNKLLRKDTTFNFDENCIKAFNTLKERLITYPVLRLYNPELPIELHTDASSIAIAGILLQKQPTGQWAPIAFFSQATNKAESLYHSFELEMLAILRSIERFHIYLYGLEFTVITDCHALVFALNKAPINPRIARWTLRLQNYRFKTIHREGRRMQHVDALSRITTQKELIAFVDMNTLEKNLQYSQLQDPKIKIIAEKLESKDNENYELIDGLVFRKLNDNSLFLVPDLMVNNIIRCYHDEMSHCGSEKTIKGILTNYWFPSMKKKVQDHINNCIKCIVFNTTSNNREGELQLTDPPNNPFDIIHIDHYGPLNPSNDGYKHILLVIDAYTRFTWLYQTKSTATKEVVSHLTELFNIFGNPRAIVSDRGTAFTAHNFASFCSERNIKHRLIAVAAPWANGLVERINRFLKSSLSKIIDNLQEWNKYLSTVQYTINNTYHSSIKTTPSKLLLGYEFRQHPDKELISLLRNIAKTELIDDIITDRENHRKLALEATDNIKKYNKMYYDERHKKPSLYKEGDFVLIRDTVIKSSKEKKFKQPYEGPYLVSRVLNKNRYVITDIPGHNITQKPYNSILSPDRMKHWIKPIPKPQSKI